MPGDKQYHELSAELAEGPRQTLGRALEWADRIERKPEWIPVLLNVLERGEPIEKARAGHILGNLGEKKPELFKSHKRQLVKIASAVSQWEVRQALCKVLPLLDLTPKQRATAADLFIQWFGEKGSSIARTCALQAMVDLADADPNYRPEAQALIKDAHERGTKAMQARCRILSSKIDWL